MVVTYLMEQYRMIDPTSSRPMEWWTVELEDGKTVEVEYNGNGGFGPVNIWTGTAYLAPVKYRERSDPWTDPTKIGTPPF